MGILTIEDCTVNFTSPEGARTLECSSLVVDNSSITLDSSSTIKVENP